MKQEGGRVDFTTKQTAFLTASFGVIIKFKSGNVSCIEFQKVCGKLMGCMGKSIYDLK